MSKPSMMQVWAAQIRAPFLLLSVVLALVGGGAAALDGVFDGLALALCMLGVSLAHAAVNLLNRVPLEELAFLANLAGGLAVTKFGAATVNLDEVRFELEHKHFISKKIKQLEELTGLVKEASAQGLRVIFTNGCFDMLHFGHIEFFRQARALGDLLVVATNSDRSIRAIKGQNRPHIRERQRLYLLASIDCIDHLILFDDETPLRLLEALRPQILVKAGHQDIVGAELVRGYGGQAFSLPLPGLEDREPTLTSIEDL